MAVDGFLELSRRGLYAFLSLVGGGLSAGGVMLLASLLAGPYGLIVGVPALMIWPIGMIVIGSPVWAILHAQGLRSRRVACIAGVVGGAVSVFAVGALMFGLHSGSVIVLLLLTLAGAFSGLVGGNVVWTLAYEERDAARA
jgi:hypothetical protein